MKKKNKEKKSFFHKYVKIILLTLVLLISVIVLLYNAFAEGNDEGKYEVKNVVIDSISDGTATFNTEDGDGKDKGTNNGIVRTFDTISYSVKYDLGLKAGQSASAEASSTRTLIIDVLFDKNISGTVNGHELKPIFGNYSYAEFTETSDPGNGNNIAISITNIYGLNNTTITPKIYIKESTDINVKSIDELPDDKKGSFASATSVTGFSATPNTCNNELPSGNNTTVSCATKITAKEDYVVRLFSATGNTNSENEGVTSFPIGYMIGMVNDSTTGIKGKYIPSSVSFNLNAISKINGTVIGSNKNEVTFNDSIDQVILENLYMPNNTSEPLVTVSLNENEQNGTASINSNQINVSNIKNFYVPLSSNSSYMAFSTGKLYLISKRKQVQLNRIDIELTTNISNTNSVTLVDDQSRKIGDYKTKIRINEEDPKMSIVNYGKSFKIETEIRYAELAGNDLDSLTNYIKIDNRAIKLKNFLNGDNSVPIKAYLRPRDSSDSFEFSADDNAEFIYGEWNSSYFRIASNAPSGCPGDISSLTPEQLMNLYGGPCIVGNNLKSTHEIISDDGSNYTGTDIPEELYLKGPIIVKTTFNSDDSNKLKDVSGKIELGAMIREDTNLINNTYQVVTSATGMFKESTTSSLYYLSNVENTNSENDMKNINNYEKTVYNFSEKKITSEHRNPCNDVNCHISGASIIVSAVKAGIPTLKSRYNGKELTDFYYYPIEWDLETSADKSAGNTSSLKELEAKIFLPNYLTLNSSELIVDVNKDGQVGQRSEVIEPISKRTIPISSLNSIRVVGDLCNDDYVEYIFKIDLEGLSTIPLLKLYTNIKLNTPIDYNFYGYVIVNYKTNTSVATVGTTSYETIEPDRNRSNASTASLVTVHNNSKITTQGISAPRYLEKNSSYSYKMQAYNNSQNNIDNVSMYYVFPHNNDSPYPDLQSQFSATDFKAKISDLPSGYEVYYNTGGEAASIIDNELSSNGNNNSWVRWTNPSTEINEVTAIKIVKQGNSSFNSSEYFGGREDGITLDITPVGSDVGDIYYNQFYIIAGTNNKTLYSSSRDKVSIYNRTISGFVWEDYDYNGIFNDEESRLENIPVSLYRISDDVENVDANDPTTFVGKEGEEWVSDTITDTKGEYRFYGLTEGRYYAKFTYDDKKYIITKRDAANSDNTPATAINSKARSFAGESVAISSIVTFDKINNSSYSNLNLGLSIKKEFAVDVKNYIKNVTITSNTGVNSYDYDKASSVTINLKNTNNKTAKVTYDFVLKNIKYFPGYVGLIQDVMPVGMTFNQNYKENQDWVLSGGVLYYTGLSGKLLVPNETYYFSLVLDFEIPSGGNYINFVSLDNLAIMGDEIPEFDFNIIDTGEQNTGEQTQPNDNSGNQNNNQNSGEGE